MFRLKGFLDDIIWSDAAKERHKNPPFLKVSIAFIHSGFRLAVIERHWFPSNMNCLLHSKSYPYPSCTQNTPNGRCCTSTIINLEHNPIICSCWISGMNRCIYYWRSVQFRSGAVQVETEGSSPNYCWHGSAVDGVGRWNAHSITSKIKIIPRFQPL